MKYLRKYNFINENKDQNLDFETFKELMYDITDEFGGNFREMLFLRKAYTLILSMDSDIDNLSEMLGSTLSYKSSTFDFITNEYKNSTHGFNFLIDDLYVKNLINKDIEEILKFKETVDLVYNRSLEIKSIIEIFDKQIFPRLKHFSNLDKLSLKYDLSDGTVNITLLLK